MIQPTVISSELDALRAAALADGNDQVALLCLASKAMYHRLQEVEARNSELATTMVQLSSLLHVPNKRKANKENLLALVGSAHEMINEVLEVSSEVAHAASE